MMTDESAVIAELIEFAKQTSLERYPTGPMRRFNQGRQTACVEAEFSVLPDLAPELRVGLFAEPRTFNAWIRFANAASRTDREKDIRGMSIKVHDVAGENLTPGVTTQDFILISHPVMVAPNVRVFLQFLRSTEAGRLPLIWFLLTHPRSLRIAIASRARPTCHLDIPYWSTTPYQFGDAGAVKYGVRPCSEITSPNPRPLTDTYLSDAIQAHLGRAEARFDFMVQFQKDPRTMPTEDASVAWSERASPFLPVAHIRIPKQEIDEPGRIALCEEARFNPWHAHVAHRPLGGLNRARRDIYPVLAEFRRNRAAPVPPGPDSRQPSTR